MTTSTLIETATIYENIKTLKKNIVFLKKNTPVGFPPEDDVNTASIFAINIKGGDPIKISPDWMKLKDSNAFFGLSWD